MQKKLMIPVAVIMLVLAGCSNPSPKNKKKNTEKLPAGYTTLPAGKIAQLLKKNPHKYTVLDMRTYREFSSGHLKNARNIDYKLDNFKKRIAKLERSKPYIIYCKIGGRSTKAMHIMAKLGFKDVTEIKRGTTGWKEAGLPLEK